LPAGAGSVGAARAIFGRRGWVSIAAHDDDDVRRAVDQGADAVLVSPIFPTRPPSPLARQKAARGVEALRAAREIAGDRLAVIALGGITLDRVGPCTSAGAHGVALLRALLASDRPAALVRSIHDAIAGRW
jgi:thiamine-phosphate pyrophosphorylase